MLILDETLSGLSGEVNKIKISINSKYVDTSKQKAISTYRGQRSSKLQALIKDGKEQLATQIEPTLGNATLFHIISDSSVLEQVREHTRNILVA